MDDKFLHDFRRSPSPAFARQLRAALDERERGFGASLFGHTGMRWASAAASVAVIAIAFSLPSVRAGAQSFLDLFRIVNVAAISFDAERLNQISLEEMDIVTLLGEQPEGNQEPPVTTSYGSIDEASAAAGFDILEPAFMPVGWSRSGVEVTESQSTSVIARTAVLDLILEQLGIDDVTVPSELDGALVSMSMSAIVNTTFTSEAGEAHLLQARNPELTLPADIEPAEIAEIGLRILGLDRDEAYRLAWTVDWRSTLLLPVPATQARFEDVSIGGNDGVLIMPIRHEGDAPMAMVLWADDSYVYAMAGNLEAPVLLEMARTAQ